MSNLPEPLQKFEGRITDVDSHEMIPAQQWADVFGKEFAQLAEPWFENGDSETTDLNHPNVPNYAGDVLPIDRDVNDFKGSRAPGALDASRRIEVMDVTGIGRQLIFPGVSPKAVRLVMSENDQSYLPKITGDRKAIGRKLMAATDEWAIGVGDISHRMRPVVTIIADTPEELYDYAESLIKRGIRAIQLPNGVLPGGKSPAHSAHDRLWAMMSEADCAVTLHIGLEGRFFETRAWGEAEIFEGYKALGEFSVDPWTLSGLHLPAQNFVATMVTGGVFERHPQLRFGAIELGAYWIGPLMDLLDLWYDNSKMFNSKKADRLPKLPSSYIRSNVRVTPFAFEDPGALMTKYDLADVLCFSTDYPHVEGGKDIFNKFYKKVAPLGAETVEKFFVTNGELLLPA